MIPSLSLSIRLFQVFPVKRLTVGVNTSTNAHIIRFRYIKTKPSVAVSIHTLEHATICRQNAVSRGNTWPRFLFRTCSLRSPQLLQRYPKYDAILLVAVCVDVRRSQHLPRKTKNQNPPKKELFWAK